jgi:hypothetical protein
VSEHPIGPYNVACSERQHSSSAATSFWGNDRFDLVEEALRKLVETGVKP